MINIYKLSNGFAISFPYLLKDQFRESFKSAKWNSTTKQWVVGPRSGTRLEQWAEEVKKSGVLEEMRLNDELDLSVAELEAQQSKLALIRSKIAEERQRKEAAKNVAAAMAETLDLLKAEQIVLDDERAKADKAAAEARSVRDLARKTLESCINLSAIKDAQTKMIYAAGKVGRQARGEWDDAQGVIRREREKLLAAGLISYGLNALAFANHNRPDRDHPRAVTLEKILEIKKIEPENDA